MKSDANFDNGNQNLLRNYGNTEAIFNKDIFKKHYFSLDTLLIDGDRYIYKIKITPNPDMIDLNSILKKQYVPVGWLYIYKDNYAIKELDYTLVAASKNARLRNRLIYNTPIHYSIILKYFEYNGKMYLNYFSCNVPKMVNTMFVIDKKGKFTNKIRKKEDRYYYTKQEIVFTEILTDKDSIQSSLQGLWNDKLFTPQPYHKEFWKHYNILLENKEQHKMIEDLEKKIKLNEQFSHN